MGPRSRKKPLCGPGRPAVAHWPHGRRATGFCNRSLRALTRPRGDRHPVGVDHRSVVRGGLQSAWRPRRFSIRESRQVQRRTHASAEPHAESGHRLQNAAHMARAGQSLRYRGVGEHGVARGGASASTKATLATRRGRPVTQAGGRDHVAPLPPQRARRGPHFLPRGRAGTADGAARRGHGLLRR